MNKRTFTKNLAYLEENDISLSSEKIWDEHPYSVELETYTDAGEDMIICLEEPTKDCLQKFINDFDINDNVMMWWHDGYEAAHKRGVPFENIKDHYTDYEDFLKRLQEVCDEMPS